MLGCWVCEVLAGVQLYSPGPGLYCSSHTALGGKRIGLDTSLLNAEGCSRQAFASFPQTFVMVSQDHVVCLPQPPRACTTCYHDLVQLQRLSSGLPHPPSQACTSCTSCTSFPSMHKLLSSSGAAAKTTCKTADTPV